MLFVQVRFENDKASCNQEALSVVYCIKLLITVLT